MITRLRLGPLEAAGCAIRRSGVHWLCADGHECRPGEVVAYCNLAVDPVGLRRMGSPPLADEHVLQVAFAPRVGGRLRIDPDACVGGYLNVLPLRVWDAADVIASLETADIAEQETGDVDLLLPLMLAGRRMGWAVDVDAGLLPGWHSRARAWWGDVAERMPTLLSLGICDATSVVRGDRSGFLELFEAATSPAHVVTASEHPMAACAPIILDQLRRTSAERAAIRAEIGRALGADSDGPTAEDCLFLGALLTQLEQSPCRDRLEILGRSGLSQRPAPEVILLSLSAEPRSLMRHRRLGFHLHILGHNLRAAGPRTRAWLRAAFEPVVRTPDDIRRDYSRLMNMLRAETGARVMVVNLMSTSGREDIFSYGAFDAPLGESLTHISAKEMNLMLEDLCEDHGATVIDVDAVAAEIGGGLHLPDGIHQSGLMQSRLRVQILRELGGPRQSTAKSASRLATASGESGRGSS
jgi:hypothetical protein